MNYTERLKHFREQLPKLGQDIDGVVKIGIKSENPGVIGERFSFGARPDYEKLKRGKYNSEESCVSMIVGLRDPSLFFFVLAGRIDFHKNDIKLSVTDKGRLETYNRDVFDYFRAAADLFREIKRDIDVGVSFKEIIYRDLPNGENIGSLFSFYRYFDTLSFLNYMQQKGYPIPDELDIWKKKKTKQAVIPVPPKTQWHQVHFRIVNRTRIEITTPDGTEPYHSDDLGFTPKVWDQFERFAFETKRTPGSPDGRSNKICHSEDQEYIKGKTYRSEAPEYIKAERSDISRLRKLLRTVFPGVEGDPIQHNKKNKRYKAEFHITEA
jgi:uncharacterized protein YjhX (UPF0386 family)